jgi:imidazolonepropionase-like amidohydrolase
MRVAVHIFYLEDAKAVLRAGADYIAHSVRDLAADQELVSLLRQRDICLCPTLMREVSTFVYESTPPFFADPFFLRHADRTMMAQLQEPQRQKAMAESPAAKRYKAALDLAKKNLKKLSDSGVRVIMGTDTGAPFGRFQGYFEHLELELMVQSGLTPMQALVSATGDAARCAKLTGKVGTLEPGAWADFLVLAKNPLDDIRNTRSLESVWIAGNRVP